MRQKLGWFRDAADDRFAGLEHNTVVYAVVVSEDRRAAASWVTDRFSLDSPQRRRR